MAQPSAATRTSPEVVLPGDLRLVLQGRFDGRVPGVARFGYPGSGFTLRFRGSTLTLLMESDSATAALTLVLDQGEPILIPLKQGLNRVPVAVPAASWNSAQTGHVLETIKRTETWQGVVTLRGVELEQAELLPPPAPPSRRLMFLGDSVTCGAGVNNNATCHNSPAGPANDAYHSYGMVLGRQMDAQVQLVCYGGRGLQRDYRGLGVKDGVLNGPEFLDLAVPTDAVAGRAPWSSSAYRPNGIVVSLGTNDFNLQATHPVMPESFVSEYAALLRKLRIEYPQAKIFATEGAIVTNPLLRQYIQQAVASVHDEKVLWVAAQHYPGNACDAHPTREQHVHMAEDLEETLRQQLHW